MAKLRFILLPVLFLFLFGAPLRAWKIEQCLSDLAYLGYCVIDRVISQEETEKLYKRVWDEYIHKAWPKCRMDDRSNWKEEFPMQNRFGIFSGAAGQTQVMWDLRQDPRIIEPFARIWGTHDLIVSMDGMSIMCPAEIREGTVEAWPHVDQRRSSTGDTSPPIGFVSESGLRTKPFTIQGQFLFEDSFEGDGGFYCIPKSHLRFDDFAPTLETFDLKKPGAAEEMKRYLLGFFNTYYDEDLTAYYPEHIRAPKGSLILWDSRTVHWNQHASADRQNPKVRMVGFLSYEPKSRMTPEGKEKRIMAYETGASTGHFSSNPNLSYSKNRIWKDYMRFLEDPSFEPTKAQLSPVGEALLGK